MAQQEVKGLNCRRIYSLNPTIEDLIPIISAHAGHAPNIMLDNTRGRIPVKCEPGRISL